MPLPHTTHCQITTTGSLTTQQIQHLPKHQELFNLLHQPNSESSSNVGMPEVKTYGLGSKLNTKIANLEVQSVPKHADAEVTVLALLMTPRLCPPPRPQCYCYPLIPLLCPQMPKIPRTFLQNWNIFLQHITSAST